ncbi:putative vitamin H transporter [Aspergillus steynii IBT 23096]|uniref:Putative vitamin H transporter n=1 Tax=Aspergillus steynii IBT 23096 TaxID=1392250 RepID=A0A2I2GEQ4_9EURO|nr:putative vitamin H transporter [Aspergillus steynii IBT 23096]PLB51364.1 putative vitamin H transporter [Aspergillus steynii IBT 23096]
MGETIGEKTAVAEVSPASQDDAHAKCSFLASFSREEEQRIMSKVNRRFCLLIGVMYLIKSMDMSNAASVKVLQVGQPSNILNELNMTADQFNWVQSIYYISYIIFEVPSNLLLKKMTPKLWQTRIFLTWGAVLACHAAVRNRQGLIGVRFILAMLETGFFPGILTQLNSWYRTDEVAKPIAWLLSIHQGSSIVGSLLCYAISYMNGMRGMSAWRWVFLLEGLLTVLFSGIIYLVLPDYPKSPSSNKWLTRREQEFIEARLSSDAPKTNDSAFDRDEIFATLKSPTQWSFTLSQLLVNIASYALMWYLPTITTSLGFTSLPSNQLLNIPPAAIGAIGIIIAAWINNAGMIVGFILFFTVSSPGALYAACMIGSFFTSTYYILFLAWRSATMKGSTGTAFAWGLQNCLGQVGGVIGPQLFQSKWAYNRYKNSFAIAVASVIAAIFANLWSWWLTNNSEKNILQEARARRGEKRADNEV